MPRQMIVAVGNIKGGVGKTTLAVNFAISEAARGQDVLLIDGDEQGTARAFTQLRAQVLGAPGYTAVALHGSELRTQIRLLQSKYGQMMVDIGGRDNSSLRAALTVADHPRRSGSAGHLRCLVLDPLSDLIRDAREINLQLRAVVVLNAADALGKDNREAAAIIREKAGFEYFAPPIVRRKAFRNAAAAGPSVLEMCRPDEKAVTELNLLASYVFGYAGDISELSHGHRKASLSQDNGERQKSREVHSSPSRAHVGSGRRGTLRSDPDPVPEELIGSDRSSGEKERLNRSSWLRYAATKELDREEL